MGASLPRSLLYMFTASSIPAYQQFLPRSAMHRPEQFAGSVDPSGPNLYIGQDAHHDWGWVVLPPADQVPLRHLVVQLVSLSSPARQKVTGRRGKGELGERLGRAMPRV